MDQAHERTPYKTSTKKLDSIPNGEALIVQKTCRYLQINASNELPTTIQSAQRCRVRGTSFTKLGCQRRCQLNALLTIKHQIHGEINKRQSRFFTRKLATKDLTLNAFFLAILLAMCTSKVCGDSIHTGHEHVSVDSAYTNLNDISHHRSINPTNRKSQLNNEGGTFTTAFDQNGDPDYSSSKSGESHSNVDSVSDKRVSTKHNMGQSKRSGSLTESSRFMMIDDGNEKDREDPEQNMRALIQRLENHENVANRAFNKTASMNQQLSSNPPSAIEHNQQRSNKSEVPMTIVSILPKANTSSNSYRKSEPSDDQSERIDVKHRYTFTVNGRELTLEPPSKSPVDSTTNSSIIIKSTTSKSLDSNSSGKRKVNRIGDFVSPDYDSGFEINGETESVSSTSPLKSLSGGFSKQYPVRSGVTKSRLSASTQPISAQPYSSSSSSSSSSLMSSSRHNGEDNYGDNEELPYSSTALSTSYENNISQSLLAGQNHELGKQDNAVDFSGNKIISDWPKSDSNKQLSTKPDRHSSKSSNSLSATNDKALATKIQNQGNNSKFPVEFNTDNNNEGANQPGEQQSLQRTAVSSKQSLLPTTHTGFNKPPKTTTKTLVSGKPTASIDFSIGSHDNGSSNNRKTNQKRKIYPRAPVYAKTRYSSQAQPVQSSLNSATNATNAGITGNKSPIAKQNGGQLIKLGQELDDSREPSFQNNNDNRNSHLDNEDKHLTIASTQPNPTRSNDAVNSVRSGRFDKSINDPIISKYSNNIDPSSTSPLSVSRQNSQNMLKAPDSVEHDLNSQSISEYKTNFTAQLPALSTNIHAQQKLADGNEKSDRVPEVVKKSPVVQRDLSNKILPFVPSPFVYSGIGGFKPTDPKIISPRNLGRSTNPYENLKNIMLNDSTGTTNSLQRISGPDTTTNRYTNDRSIVRTGSILPNPLASYSQLKALMPGLFMRDAHEDYQSATNQFRAMLAGHPLASSGQVGQMLAATADYPYSRATSSSTNQNLSGADQMLATSNQHSVAHLGPRTTMNTNAGESSNYNSITSLQDYPERQLQNHDQITGGQESSIGANSRPSTPNNMVGEEHTRASFSETDQNSFEPNASLRSSTQNAVSNEPAPTNSRSSVSDVYLRTEHKNRADSAGSYPMRGSADSFEDLAGGLSTSEYERDLADLDEEFNRQSSFRRPSNPLMSDSFMSMSPERYEARRYNRRPYNDYTADYLNTAGSMSSIIPRPYQRSHASPWSSSSAYSDNSDLWADTSVDYNPMASFVSPNHYAYRWRPRYQRVSPYSTSPYLATSASEQHLQPAYNIIPSYASAVPTETISYALSPLAAAAAAAASALVAADKTRHQNHGWLALPRLAASSAISPTPTAASASTQHASTIPAGAIQTAYIHRPSPYALSSVPVYAIAQPRPAAPLATASSGATASIIPYFHSAAPTLIAYRPAGLVPSSSLLATHSFAYPLRLPVSTIHRPGPIAIAAPTRTGGRPFYSDLAFAESKAKTNLTSNSSEGKGLVRAGGLTAMAKSLTKKMFGSASQIRPQHVAPPNAFFDQYTPSQNSSAITLSSTVAV